MQLYLKRTLSGFAPAHDADVHMVRSIKLDAIVRAEIVIPRNIKHHRKFFALLNTVWSATDGWPTVEDLLVELKVRLGITKEVVIRGSGEIVKVLDSISFAAMDQGAFDAFYESALKELCEMAGGIESEMLREEVLNQLAAA